jgi:hypothetical protein
VPAIFPLALARRLEASGVRLELVEGLFWAARETKLRPKYDNSSTRYESLDRNCAVCEVLAASHEGLGRRLMWGGAVLTSSGCGRR